MMKAKALILVVLLFASAVSAQKRPERPRVHSDFYFGAFPTSRSAADLMSREQARLLMVAFHEGWDVPKAAKELKLAEDDLYDLYDELEEARLAGNRNEYEVRPFLPVIRDRDIDRIKGRMDEHTTALAELLQSNWSEIEAAIDSLEGAREVARPQALYQVVVSGLLLGAMPDAFYEDKTLLPPGPRRTGGDRFYAWLVEGDPALAGTLQRETRDSDGFTIVSIGSSLPASRVTLDQIREAQGIVLNDADARKFRSFAAVFSRDKLLPFFKNKRSEFLRLGSQVDSGKYVAFAEFFGWYYDQLVNGAVQQLVSAGRIAAPAEYYTYATRVPLR